MDRREKELPAVWATTGVGGWRALWRAGQLHTPTWAGGTRLGRALWHAVRGEAVGASAQASELGAGSRPRPASSELFFTLHYL